MRNVFATMLVIVLSVFLPAFLLGSCLLQAGETLLTIEPTNQQPRNSEGDLIELADGRLCLIYSRFTTGTSDHAEADLAMRCSSDGGQTWSPDKIVIPREGGRNVMSVSLLRLADGQIALFYLRKVSLEDCRPIMRISNDECVTFGPPIECIEDEVGYYVMNNDRAVQLESGRLILPVALHNRPGDEKPDWAGRVMCYLSDDVGQTWRRSKTTRIGHDSDGARVTLQEPGVVELAGGQLKMFCRTGAGCQYVATSPDGGDNWPELVPSALASPMSPATIERIPFGGQGLRGQLLCAWNDHSGVHPFPPGKRSPFCIATSADGGETWSQSRTIETDPEGWYCYTAMMFQGDRVILAYCAGDQQVGGLNRLKVVALSAQELVDVATSATEKKIATDNIIAPALATSEPDDQSLWYDIQLLEVEGRGWNDTKAFYDRLPAKAEGVVRAPVWGLSRKSAGICVRFATDAESIHARWTLTSGNLAMKHMPATGVSGLDLYVKTGPGEVAEGRWRWLAVGQPDQVTNKARLVSQLPAGTREYMLYLPLYNGVTSVEIGIPQSSTLSKAEPYPSGQRKPILFYGTSITQGGCASRPGMVHTAILGRWLNRPVLNLGFSGNGKMEPEMAILFAELDPAIYILDCLPNMVASEITERVEPFVRTLRQAHPATPILLVEDRSYTNAFLLESARTRNDSSRQALRAAYERLLTDGVKGLHYLTGDQLLGDDGEGTVDSSHPTDLGFMRQAEIMRTVLEPILE